VQFAEAKLAEGDERSLGSFADYDGMLNIVRARVLELQVNGERFDEFAGLPKGYLSKLIGAHPIRKIHMTSMAPVFSALGIYCVVFEEPGATARLKGRLVPNQSNYMRPTYTHVVVTNRKWARIQKLGHQARQAVWNKFTPQQRSDMMRALALKRWRNGHR
jgi:hypothetical protein